MEDRPDLLNAASIVSARINEAYDTGEIDEETKMELHSTLDDIIYTITDAE